MSWCSFYVCTLTVRSLRADGYLSCVLVHHVLRGVVTLVIRRCYSGAESDVSLFFRSACFLPSFWEPVGGGAADIPGFISRRNLVARSLVWGCMEPMCSGVASCWGRLAVSVFGARKKTSTHIRAYSIQQQDALPITDRFVIAISRMTSLSSSCRHAMRSHACMSLNKNLARRVGSELAGCSVRYFLRKFMPYCTRSCVPC